MINDIFTCKKIKINKDISIHKQTPLIVINQEKIHFITTPPLFSSSSYLPPTPQPNLTSTQLNLSEQTKSNLDHKFMCESIHHKYDAFSYYDTVRNNLVQNNKIKLNLSKATGHLAKSPRLKVLMPLFIFQICYKNTITNM